MGLGLVEEDSEELIDDDLLDDDLEDLSEEVSDELPEMSETTEAPTPSIGSDVEALMGTAESLFSSGQVQAAWMS